MAINGIELTEEQASATLDTLDTLDTYLEINKMITMEKNTNE